MWVAFTSRYGRLREGGEFVFPYLYSYSRGARGLGMWDGWAYKHLLHEHCTRVEVVMWSGLVRGALFGDVPRVMKQALKHRDSLEGGE